MCASTIPTSPYRGNRSWKIYLSDEVALDGSGPTRWGVASYPLRKRASADSVSRREEEAQPPRRSNLDIDISFLTARIKGENEPSFDVPGEDDDEEGVEL